MNPEKYTPQEYSNNPEELFEVAKSGDQKKLIDLYMLKHPDFNVRNSDGATALMIAAANGQEQIAMSLYMWGADVNAEDNHGKTALDYAVEHNHKNLVLSLKMWSTARPIR